MDINLSHTDCLPIKISPWYSFMRNCFIRTEFAEIVPYLRFRFRVGVSVQGVESLWGDCRFFPGGIVVDLCYFALFEDFSLSNALDWGN